VKRYEFLLTPDSLETPPKGLAIPNYGAMLEFLGVVRPEEEGKPIEAIVYEAYPEMARVQAERILTEILNTHDILAIQVIHRTGRVPTHEISLRVRTYSKHRKAAYAASLDFIERLKKDVPIWKVPI
jgi:molybdopterin synthase catalytic subunit